MFNNRTTVIPDIVWHEPEPNQFYMRTADDHGRVYQAKGGEAAGKWRAILNDSGLYGGANRDVSWFESEYLAKQAFRNEYKNIIHKRVHKAREVMTFYTSGVPE